MPKMHVCINISAQTQTRIYTQCTYSQPYGMGCSLSGPDYHSFESLALVASLLVRSTLVKHEAADSSERRPYRLISESALGFSWLL